ncbi:MAG: class I adenylate-forming enzyme family protein [Candidatus Sumerlaeia bacterium]
MRKVHDIPPESAERWPHQTALVDGLERIYYHQFLRHVRNIRARLLQIGAGPGTGIGLLMRDSATFMVCAFACMDCGATVLPLSNRLKRAQLENMFDTCLPHALIEDGTGPHVLDAFSNLVETPGLSPVRFSWTGFSRHRPFTGHVPDPALMAFTSGVTGQPKGVVLSHTSAMERIEAVDALLDIDSHDTILYALPMAHHFWSTILLFLHKGAQTILCPGISAEDLLQLAWKNQATRIFAPPNLIKAMAYDYSGEDMVGTLVGVYCLGGPLSETVTSRFMVRYNMPVSQAYDSVEAGLPLINTSLPEDIPVSVGQPDRNWSIGIFGENGNPLRDGVAGELGLRGPGLFTAYRHPHRMREEVLRDGWYMTGDIAERDSENAITILGRKSRRIKIDDTIIYPEQVEKELNALPVVRKSRVSLVSFPSNGEKGLQAEVVPLTPKSPPPPEDIVRYCRQFFSGAWTLRSVKLVESLPTTPCGKILDRRRLKAR